MRKAPSSAVWSTAPSPPFSRSVALINSVLYVLLLAVVQVCLTGAVKRGSGSVCTSLSWRKLKELIERKDLIKVSYLAQCTN